MEILCDCGKKLIWTESIDGEPGKSWIFGKGSAELGGEVVIEAQPDDNFFDLRCVDCDINLINVHKGPLPEGRNPATIQIIVN
jgi:hypothetical protein